MYSKEGILNILTGVVAVSSVAAVLLVARREFVPAPVVAAQATEVHVKDTARFQTGRYVGPPNAALVIDAFSDYECSACRRLWGVAQLINERSPGSLGIRYRHFPLDYHRSAYRSARAAECAGEQGQFEAFHNALFTSFDTLGQVSMDTLAHQLGTLDVARFARCSADSTKVPQIEAAIADANELGIRGTPAIIIGGMFRNGVPDIKDLERRVADARNRRTIVP